jgi:hypothetical protein
MAGCVKSVGTDEEKKRELEREGWATCVYSGRVACVPG